MQNSVRHTIEKQTLQTQAEQLLPMISLTLSDLGYQNVLHQRLSHHNNIEKIYQGLSRAVHEPFGEVMIKWQLSTDSSFNSASLNQEIEVLEALNSLQNTNKIAIAPPMLFYETLSLNLLEQNHSLTCLVMPYYRHGSLAQYLRQPLTIEQKHVLIIKAAELISSIHDKGWLHNDIKPSNMVINEEYDLLLTDFALAEPIENNDKNKDRAKNSAGTPAYLAPERWQGHSTTVPSDIYAFGIMLYEILVGKRPFAIDPSSSELLKDWAIQHCQQPIPILPSQYGRYQFIVDSILAKRVEKRYQSMEEVLIDLTLLENK